MRETSWVDSDSWDYHKSQWSEPKRSTKWIGEILEQNLLRSRFVVDVGCGGGPYFFPSQTISER